MNAAAKNDASYKGPRIDVSDDPLLKDVRTIPSKDKLIFIEKAMEDFSNFASPPTNLVPNINTLMGFQIEGEAVFDKNGKSIPISGLSILDQNSNSKKASKKLPENSTRYIFLFCLYAFRKKKYSENYISVGIYMKINNSPLQGGYNVCWVPRLSRGRINS